MTSKINSRQRGMVLLACVLIIFMSAIEVTIASTAMPTIIADLGGFSQMSWVFSVYLLAQLISAPIFGRLADLYGRKKLFFVAVILFLSGSILCGFSESMIWLIAFRALQGLGTGGIAPIATTIIGDIYTPAERPKVLGYLSSIWAISAIIGPLMGAFIVENYTWPFVFWVNIPFGIVAILILFRYLPEKLSENRPYLDFKGTFYMVISVCCLLVVLLQPDELSIQVIVILLTISMITGYLFLQQQKKSPGPLFPLSLWKNKVIVAANFGSLALGAAMMGLTVFLPTFIQGVMGLTPYDAGMTLALISIGWPLASALSSSIMSRTSYRFTVGLGSLVLIIGSLLLLNLNMNSSIIWCQCAAFLIGAGMGFSTTTYLIAVQNNVAYEMRGISTASITFSRLLGSSLGAAALGAILNISLNHYAPGITEPVQLLVQPELRQNLAAEQFLFLIDSVTTSLFMVFLVSALFSLLSIITFLLLPAKLKPENNLTTS